jgi:WD40 repeat protein
MRGFLITLVLGLAAFAGAAWYLDLFAGSPDATGNLANTPEEQPAKVARELGPPLFKPVPAVPVANDVGRFKDPIVTEGHFVIVDKQEVPSKRSGQLLFIGAPVPDNTPVAAGETVYSAKVYQGGKEVTVRYKPLEEGARVKEDQIVAMLDYSLALNDWMSKKAKIEAARADYDSAIKTELEAQARLDRMDALKTQSSKFVTPEEYSATVLTRDRYRYEKESKKAGITVAEIDAEQAEIIYREHEIHNKIPGLSILKTIYKHRGEAVKEQDPIMQLYNLDRLRAEGLIEVQYFERLREGMKVSLEPMEEEAPLRVLNEHRGEVTSVAVSGDEKNPLIVSGSKDGTVRVWSRTQSHSLRILYHPAPVLSVACSPRGCARHWLLTGCADGSLRLWDLDKNDDQPVWDSSKGDQPSPHRDAITALAFSPDGTYFATGGEDNNIALWKTDGGKLVYLFDPEHGVDNPHQGTITALHFTPQCHLISASRDNTLRVWELREKGAYLVVVPLTGRSGNVGDLGVSADGAWMLFDKGKALQVVSLTDRRTHSVIQHGQAGTPFETLALFSPDARLVLTAGAAEGRLQLWKAPTDGKHSFELRQFATAERSPVTCAAFAPDAGIAPDGSFAVSGTKDGFVYIWPVPNRDKVAKHRIENLPLTLIENSLDASTRQVRIGVNVRNPINDEYPTGRLIPGRPVNIVIEPQ